MLNYKIDGVVIHIETDCLQAEVRTEGYVSGVAAGTLLDKATGARDLGFGLSIVDFLLEDGEDDPDAPNAYHWGDKYHGNIPKRYVELPQICTQARKLPFQVTESSSGSQKFIAVKQWYNWTIATRGREPGSLWEQILIFPEDTRYFFSTDRVTSVNTVRNLALRVDMPGHLKHDKGDSFSEIYLSYHGTIPNTEFLEDFPPDARFRYVRHSDPLPERMIRAYRTRSGAWLAGMTLNPSVVSEAWCHQRGYVCFIQENGQKEVQAGETFSATYIIGFFDSVEEMEEVYDKHYGWSNIVLSPSFEDAKTFLGSP
ncbi:hypothetical protein ACFL6S_10295 [Candidatus Poribacteria bacterium]